MKLFCDFRWFYVIFRVLNDVNVGQDAIHGAFGIWILGMLEGNYVMWYTVVLWFGFHRILEANTGPVRGGESLMIVYTW